MLARNTGNTVENTGEEETITLTASALARMLAEARRAGRAEVTRKAQETFPVIPFDLEDLKLIDTLLKSGHTPFMVFRAMELGITPKDAMKRVEAAGYFIRTTLFARPYLRNNRKDVFSVSQLADIKTLLEIGAYKLEDIAERYKKQDSQVNAVSYFNSKLTRSGYIVGHLLEKRP